MVHNRGGSAPEVKQAAGLWGLGRCGVESHFFFLILNYLSVHLSVYRMYVCMYVCMYICMCEHVYRGTHMRSENNCGSSFFLSRDLGD